MHFRMQHSINQKLLLLYEQDRQKKGPINPFLNKLQNNFNSKIPFQTKQDIKKICKNDGNNFPNTNRILIVDDEIDITSLFRIALEKEGFIVDVFNDPIEALSHYKSGYYDLLLLDVKMPQMSGFELYQKIKDSGDDTNVCFITAFEEYYDEFKKLYHSFDELDCFIRKPIGIDTLTKIIKKRLQNYKKY